MMRKTVEIQNLKCGGCEATIIKNLSVKSGIQNVSVNIENSSVSFDYDTQDTLPLVYKILGKLGYPIVGTENSFGKKAKSYVSCAVGRIGK